MIAIPWVTSLRRWRYGDRRANPSNLSTVSPSAAPMVPSSAIRAVEVSVPITVWSILITTNAAKTMNT